MSEKPKNDIDLKLRQETFKEWWEDYLVQWHKIAMTADPDIVVALAAYEAAWSHRSGEEKWHTDPRDTIEELIETCKGWEDLLAERKQQYHALRSGVEKVRDKCVWKNERYPASVIGKIKKALTALIDEHKCPQNADVPGTETEAG